jgi:hypothetical protein
MEWIRFIGRALWILVIAAVVGLALITSLTLFLSARKGGEPVPIGVLFILVPFFILLIIYSGARWRSEKAQKGRVQLFGGIFIAIAIGIFVLRGPETFEDCKGGLLCWVFAPLPPYSMEFVLVVLGLPIAYRGIKDGVSSNAE